MSKIGLGPITIRILGCWGSRVVEHYLSFAPLSVSTPRAKGLLHSVESQAVGGGGEVQWDDAEGAQAGIGVAVEIG